MLSSQLLSIGGKFRGTGGMVEPVDGGDVVGVQIVDLRISRNIPVCSGDAGEGLGKDHVD
jgi:hypothetical protein